MSAEPWLVGRDAHCKSAPGATQAAGRADGVARLLVLRPLSPGSRKWLRIYHTPANWCNAHPRSGLVAVVARLPGIGEVAWAPCLCEILAAPRAVSGRQRSRTGATTAKAVLAGCFCLRLGLVGAGIHVGLDGIGI